MWTFFFYMPGRWHYIPDNTGTETRYKSLPHSIHSLMNLYPDCLTVSSPWLSHHRTIVSACLWCVVTMAVVSRSWHKRIGMWFYSTVWRRRAIGRLSTLWRSWRSATTSSSTCSSPSSSKDSPPRYTHSGSTPPFSLEILLVLFDNNRQRNQKFFFALRLLLLWTKEGTIFHISFTPHGLVGSWHILRE